MNLKSRLKVYSVINKLKLTVKGVIEYHNLSINIGLNVTKTWDFSMIIQPSHILLATTSFYIPWRQRNDSNKIQYFSYIYSVIVDTYRQFTRHTIKIILNYIWTS